MGAHHIHLTKVVIDIDTGTVTLLDDGNLAGRGICTAQAVDLATVG